MAYIRKKEEELTGYQEGAHYSPAIDLDCDFIMVYGIDDSMPQRIREFREKGYVIQLMTGIAWGQYQKYLNGEVDGRKHWDEGQKARGDVDVIHNPTVPYMVPAISFADFLIGRLKKAVDSGVVAIHVEEPEFWDRSGYSKAFQREYEIYYREPWQAQHESLDVRYKSARLKAYLYARTIDRVSSALKEYAKVTYGRDLRFYVPTHSLLNYTQWKIISPESMLIDLPGVDGYIAQIWTGTSRTPNVYEGVCRERTFEMAYLEYSIMQELVKGSGRRMWFLNDPVEDLPSYTWENYEYNYVKTATASLLHPNVWHYEICPWPTRVFTGKFPRFQPRIKEKIETSFETEESKPIPAHYATLLSSFFQMFGDMDQKEWSYEGAGSEVGLVMSDTGLYQRTFPDGIVNGRTLDTRLDEVTAKNTGNKVDAQKEKQLMQEIGQDPSLMLDFIQSGAFPNFYGMALPLLKYGLTLSTVQLENVSRFAGYLDDKKVLILSYEYIKPANPSLNASLVSWVMSGGTLLYIGDGSDPYHAISSWWRKAGYENPAQHLFELLGLGREPKDGEYTVGKGRVQVWNRKPASLCLTKEAADEYRTLVKRLLSKLGITWTYRNDLTLHRGPYIISAVMDESVSDKPKCFDGLFADMLDNRYALVRHTEIPCDHSCILFDFSRIEGESFRVIGTTARIEDAQVTGSQAVFTMKTADNIQVYSRIRLPKKVVCASAIDEDGQSVPVSCEWDATTRTVLLGYLSHARKVTVTAEFAKE